MIVGEVYRLNLPTLGIHMKDGQRIAVTIPKDALITVIGGPLDGTRLVDCLWEGTEVMLFTLDIRERGTLVRSASG